MIYYLTPHKYLGKNMITNSHSHFLPQTSHVDIPGLYWKQFHHKIAPSLLTNTSLTTLDATCVSASTLTPTTEKSLVQIFEACTSLRELNLSDLGTDERGIHVINNGLARLTKLEKLNLSRGVALYGCQPLSFFYATISKLPALTDLNVSENTSCPSNTLLRHPESLPNIRKLDISKNVVMSEGEFSSLCELIKNRTSLTDLNHAYNEISEEQLDQLTEALQASVSLRKLNLCFNDFKSGAAFTRFARALSHNTVLESLNLNRNKIGTDGATALSRALRHNTTLTNLYLAMCQIPRVGVSSLLDLVKENTTLQSLNLYGCKLWADHLPLLSQALIENSSLTDIALEISSLEKTDVPSFAGWTDANTTLTTLYLDLPRAGEGVIEWMFAAAIASTALTDLTIHSDTGKVKDPVVMLQMALLTPTLRKFDIDVDLEIRSVDFEPIVHYCHQNTSLQSLTFCGSYNQTQLDSFRRALFKNQSITEFSLLKTIMDDRTFETWFNSIIERNKQNALMRRASLLQLLWERLSANIEVST